jgi:hypothetical protein
MNTKEITKVHKSVSLFEATPFCPEERGNLGENEISPQNQWVSGLCPSSGILNTRKLETSKLDLIPSSGEGWGTHTLSGPLERFNLSHWLALSTGPNRVGVSFSSL